MNTTPINCRIHRFGDRVAISVHEGPTVYLTPGDAKKLSDAMNACALNCLYTPFTQSQFGARDFAFVGKA